MNKYKPIAIKSYPSKSGKSTELRKFKKFEVTKTMSVNLTCNDIKICQENPSFVTFFIFDTIYNFDLITDSVVTKYPQSTEQISCGNIRNDAKLIYSGMINGKVNVYEANKKILIRTYNAHKLQINSIDISPTQVKFLTTSNDTAMKIFDLTRSDPVHVLNKSHSDYVKTAKYIDENTIISGGYDKVVKMWDIRTESCVKVYDNFNACSDLLVLDSERIVTTAENLVNVFDTRTDSVLLQANPVQSNISRICVDRIRTRLFTVAPGENFVKVLDMNNLKSLFSIKMKSAISSFDVAADLNRYAAGYDDGSIAILSRNLKDEEEEDINKDQEDKDMELLDPTKYATKEVVKNYRYFFRGQYEDNLQEGDITVESGKKRKLQEHDILLKKFQYHNALDSVLKKKNVEVTMGVIEELIDRNALKLAIMNRSEEELELLLKFVLWKIRDPKTMNTMLYLFNLLIDYYMIVFDKSERIRKLFVQISNAIKEEIQFEKNLLNINSKIDSINNISSY